MREANLLEHFQFPTAPVTNGRGGPFANSINREDGSLFKGRRIKRAGGMGLVVSREKDATIRAQARDFRADCLAQIEPFAEPVGKHAGKSREPARRHGEISLEQAGKFLYGLVVKDNGVQLRRLKPGTAKAELDRLDGELRIVFPA